MAKCEDCEATQRELRIIKKAIMDARGRAWLHGKPAVDAMGELARVIRLRMSVPEPASEDDDEQS